MKEVSFKKGLAILGYSVQKYTKGYNFRSAFATNQEGELYYFSIEDLRDDSPGIMRRTAKSLTDYTGGTNLWDVRSRLWDMGYEIKENRTGKDYNSQ